jgi:hypothetical protein
MEDKRRTKCLCSPSKEGSPSPSDTKTPSPAPSGSPPPPGYLSGIFSHHPCSPVFEQGGPSVKAPVVDLHLLMRKVSSMMYCRMRSSPKGFLVTSTAMSLGHPAMARSSSSMTPTKKRMRCARRRPPASKMWLLLLQSTPAQPPPPMPTLQLQG